MLNEAINKSAAMEVFEHESILIGERDVMPIFKAKRFLGADAVDFSKKDAIDRNSYYIGDSRHVTYLTLKGFLKAVIYRNVCLLQQEKAPFPTE